jgi:hypothetical protein
MNTDDLSEKSKYILECIKNIQKDKNTLTKTELINKWSAFYNEYPFISIILEDEDIDLSILIEMLFKIDKINDNKITKEKAEIEFGNILSKNYLNQFEQPDKESIIKSYKLATKQYEQTKKEFNL